MDTKLADITLIEAFGGLLFAIVFWIGIVAGYLITKTLMERKN